MTANGYFGSLVILPQNCARFAWWSLARMVCLPIGVSTRDVEHRLGDLVGVGAARLGDRRGQDLHADIARDRPGRGMLLLRVGAQTRDVFLVRRRSTVPVERVVGVGPDAERIVVAHGLGGLDRSGFAGAEEVVAERLEIA